MAQPNWRFEPVGDETIELETGVKIPRTFRAWRTSSDDVPFHVELELTHRGARVVCDHLALRRKSDGSDVTGEALRSVAVGRLIAEALERVTLEASVAQLGRRRRRTTSAEPPRPGALSKGRGKGLPPVPEWELSPEARASVRRSVDASTDTQLREIARIYRLYAGRPGPNGRPIPRRMVEQTFGLTTNQAREAIRRAKREGLL